MGKISLLEHFFLVYTEKSLCYNIAKRCLGGYWKKSVGIEQDRTVKYESK